MNRRIITLLIVLVVCGFVCFSMASTNACSYSDEYKEYNKEIIKLKNEKNNLENKLSLISSKTNASLYDVGATINYDDSDISDIVDSVKEYSTPTILLLDDDNRHMDNAVRILNDNNYHALIVLSKDHLENNKENCFSDKQIRALVSRGYQFIVKLDKGEDVDKSYYYFTDRGYDIKGFYINGDITEDIIYEIKDLNKNMIIIGNSIEFNGKDLLYINAVAYLQHGVKNFYADRINNLESVALEVCYENDDSSYVYNENSFVSMLDFINQNVSNGNTKVVNLSEYIDNYLKAEKDLEDRNNKIEGLRKELENIEDEIIDIKVNDNYENQ